MDKAEACSMVSFRNSWANLSTAHASSRNSGRGCRSRASTVGRLRCVAAVRPSWRNAFPFPTDWGRQMAGLGMLSQVTRRRKARGLLTCQWTVAKP